MAQRATSLALNSPYFSFCLFCFCFFLAFLSLFLFHRKRPVSPPSKKEHFWFLFECLPLFIFSLFWASSFCTFSFFVSLLFFSFFLSVSHFCIWFLLVLFVFFAFLFKMLLYLFYCLLSCFVLSHNISFLFPLHLVFHFCFFVFVALVFRYFFMFGFLSTNISAKNWKFQNSKNEKCRKKDILTRAS